MTLPADSATTVFAATCDLAGLGRGRSVPSAAHDAVLRGGTGWIPANLAISSFRPTGMGFVIPSRVSGVSANWHESHLMRTGPARRASRRHR